MVVLRAATISLAHGKHMQYRNLSIYVTVGSKKRRRKSNFVLLIPQNVMILTRNLQCYMNLQQSLDLHASWFQKRERKSNFVLLILQNSKFLTRNSEKLYEFTAILLFT